MVCQQQQNNNNNNKYLIRLSYLLVMFVFISLERRIVCEMEEGRRQEDISRVSLQFLLVFLLAILHYCLPDAVV